MVQTTSLSQALEKHSAFPASIEGRPGNVLEKMIVLMLWCCARENIGKL
jgi:hypothetical protein